MPHHHLKANSQHTIIEEWVVGHASKKRKNCPKAITLLEEENSQCDSDAEDCIVDDEGPTPFQPFHG